MKHSMNMRRFTNFWLLLYYSLYLTSITGYKFNVVPYRIKSLIRIITIYFYWYQENILIKESRH
jgi:hypothetical protein